MGKELSVDQLMEKLLRRSDISDAMFERVAETESRLKRFRPAPSKAEFGTRGQWKTRSSSAMSRPEL